MPTNSPSLLHSREWRGDGDGELAIAAPMNGARHPGVAKPATAYDDNKEDDDDDKEDACVSVAEPAPRALFPVDIASDANGGRRAAVVAVAMQDVGAVVFVVEQVF